jgi:hypothetical protein
MDQLLPASLYQPIDATQQQHHLFLRNTKTFSSQSQFCFSTMWTIPPLENIEATLCDPEAPIGKRMRAAYYAKQLFMNEKTKAQQEYTGCFVPTSLCEGTW